MDADETGLVNLPEEACLLIFAFLEHHDIVSVQQSCVYLFRIAASNSMYRLLCQRCFSKIDFRTTSLQQSWKERFKSLAQNPSPVCDSGHLFVSLDHFANYFEPDEMNEQVPSLFHSKIELVSRRRVGPSTQLALWDGKAPWGHFRMRCLAWGSLFIGARC
jgi:hypothetical protein